MGLHSPTGRALTQGTHAVQHSAVTLKCIIVSLDLCLLGEVSGDNVRAHLSPATPFTHSVESQYPCAREVPEPQSKYR